MWLEYSILLDVVWDGFYLWAPVLQDWLGIHRSCQTTYAKDSISLLLNTIGNRSKDSIFGAIGFFRRGWWFFSRTDCSRTWVAVGSCYGLSDRLPCLAELSWAYFLSKRVFPSVFPNIYIYINFPFYLYKGSLPCMYVNTQYMNLKTDWI